MSLLSYTEICALIESGVIEGADYSHVNSSSLDIHLGSEVLMENMTCMHVMVSLKNKDCLTTTRVSLEDPFTMLPGDFILAHSKEIFHLPNDISAEYKLCSSMARLGLDHLNAGWCDAGWNGSVLTLELKNVTNNHRIVLHPGVRIGQIVFFRHTPVPADKSYAVRGRYNGDKTVSGVKR